MEQPPVVAVVGGGYAGMYVARGLERRLRPLEAEIVLVSPESFAHYHPFLPEAAAGNIEPRHAVVPLRGVLRRTRLIPGTATGLDHPRRTLHVRLNDGGHQELRYDHVVVAVGSVARVLPVPGLREHAVGFTTLTEAIHLRNHVLSRLDVAAASPDPARRRRALTFVFVGGGYSGVEALAELEDLARDAAAHYPEVDVTEMRWVLVEARDRILPEVDPALSDHARRSLEERGVVVLTGTRLARAGEGLVELDDGTVLEADTLVWTAGVRAHPFTAATGFSLDERGRILTDRYLRVAGTEGAWAVGDAAAVPDPTTGGYAPPTAQHALREARAAARNVAARLRGRPLRAFSYRNRGLLVSLGRHRGVASVLGVRLRGLPAWVLHRTYHLLMVPTLSRKARVAADWTVALLFSRDTVQLGSLQRPRAPIESAFESLSD